MNGVQCPIVASLEHNERTAIVRNSSREDYGLRTNGRELLVIEADFGERKNRARSFGIGGRR